MTRRRVVVSITPFSCGSVAGFNGSPVSGSPQRLARLGSIFHPHDTGFPQDDKGTPLWCWLVLGRCSRKHSSVNTSVALWCNTKVLAMLAEIPHLRLELAEFALALANNGRRCLGNFQRVNLPPLPSSSTVGNSAAKRQFFCDLASLATPISWATAFHSRMATQAQSKLSDSCAD